MHTNLSSPKSNCMLTSPRDVMLILRSSLKFPVNMYFDFFSFRISDSFILAVTKLTRDKLPKPHHFQCLPIERLDKTQGFGPLNPRLWMGLKNEPWLHMKVKVIYGREVPRCWEFAPVLPPHFILGVEWCWRYHRRSIHTDSLNGWMNESVCLGWISQSLYKYILSSCEMQSQGYSLLWKKKIKLTDPIHSRGWI